MVIHPCPRCGAIIPVGVSYCEKCKPIAEAAAAEAIARRQAYKRAKYNRDYNKRRDPKYLTFYRSKDWKITSRAKLQDCGYKCEAHLDDQCKRIATDVHHIKPLKTEEGWDERLEWSNLLCVCAHCHNILDGKTFKHKDDDGVIDLRRV